MALIKGKYFKYNSPPLPRKLPWLEGAMSLMGLKGPRGSKGMCVHRSVALVLDVPGTKLCMGIFRAARPDEQLAMRGAGSDEPFIHCWVEWDGVVLAPSLIEAHNGGLYGNDRDNYLKQNGARDLREMSRPALITLAKKYGFRRHLIGGKELPGPETFGTVVMNACWGSDWTTSEYGGLLPLNDIAATQDEFS